MASLTEARPAALEAASDIDRALDREILAAEQLRVRVLFFVLVAFMAVFIAMLLLSEDIMRRVSGGAFSIWYPIGVITPFIFYEGIANAVLQRWGRNKRSPPRRLRFLNALIETSLPTAIMIVSVGMIGPTGFGIWPLLYGVYVAASTLRLEFALPFFTGAVAAVEYLVATAWLLPLSFGADDSLLTPPYHFGKALLLLSAGTVAGLVAKRLRQTFVRVVEESTARDRITSLFGEHVSPVVVDHLLSRSRDAGGELREVCVLFLDIRNFTAFARTRSPQEVVDYLNGVFAFMIEAIDRHHGIVNKFLGDGFIAIFGAPLDDPQAVRGAVSAARDILAEIDRRGLDKAEWPLRVGIGIHTGKVVTGNVGSPRRKEYTVIGDVVNLAARLEQATKDFRARLLVSEAVAHRLGGELGPAIAVGPVAVKGYDTPVPVWQLDPVLAGQGGVVSL